MTWSVARSHRAASEIRSAHLGRRACLTIRPRGQFGFLRARPPLTLLLYVAAQDGLVVEQDGGFAVLRRPWADPPVKTGGIGLRVLRRLDRHWDMALFGIPAAAGLVIAAATAIDRDTRHIALFAACAVVVWVNVFLLGMICSAPGWMARIGLSPAAGHNRDAEDLSAMHWSVALVHQPDAGRIDGLIQRLVARMADLIGTEVKDSASGRARVDSAVTDVLVVLPDGVTTQESQAAIANSPRRIADYPAVNVFVLEPSTWSGMAAQPARSGSGFFLIYLTGLAAVIITCPWLVESTENRACGIQECENRPTSYLRALRWIVRRLFFTDPPHDSPRTLIVTSLGWLVSIASVMLAALAIIAIRRLMINERENKAEQKARIDKLLAGPRVLILVVTEVERDAVLRSARSRVRHEPGIDGSGPRVIYVLGTVANCKVLLAQAGELGTSSMDAMPGTAIDTIRQCQPDYVVLTGICFGLRPDRGQQISDIVVARRVQDLNLVKQTDDPQNPTIYRGTSFRPSAELLSRFQAGQVSWLGASVHLGLMLTSNTLVDSLAHVSRLQREFPDAIAGEMEATAVYEAATTSARSEWIMVKAISDWGFSKTEEAQPAAARNAAEFVMHVIASGSLRRPPDRFR